MNKHYSLSFVLLMSFATFSCGGGGSKTSIELGEEDVEVEGGSDYKCAVGTSSMVFFEQPETTNLADFSKKTGMDLSRYFYNITSKDDPDKEKEIRNKYIQRYSKHYVLDQPSGFEIKGFEPYYVQSLLDDWRYIGKDYAENINVVVSANEEWDEDIPRYAFQPAEFQGLIGALLPSDFVQFAEIGDTVAYTNSQSFNFEIKSFCSISDEFITEQLKQAYGEVISLNCTSHTLSDPDSTTGKRLFTGSKSKLYLAKDIGIVSDLTDVYQAVIENTQETEGKCVQSYGELVETKIVPRVYTPDLGKIVP